MNVIDKKWGYELIIENNDYYCGKHLHIMPHKKSSVHYHTNKIETFYVIQGSMLLEYSRCLDLDSWLDGVNVSTIKMSKGDSFTLNPLVAHRYSSIGNCSCDFIEFSTHDDISDTIRIIQSQ